ncbi:MAG: radical SAM protein [archaeon]|nr:radical SAM protein [archaeon]
MNTEYNPRVNIFTNEYELLDGSKQRLVQQVADGSIIKRFEKTPLPAKPTDVICPHFLELKWAYGCPFNCAWCYLKGTFRFLETKTKPVFKDREKVKLHIETFFATYPKEILNTGEIADSLMDENGKEPFSKFLIPLFEIQDRHKVLFLTKSDKVKHLLEIEKHDHAIISFSLNTPENAERWEIGAAPVARRIEAAKEVSDAGYETRVRIDPMIPFPESQWEDEYKELVDQIFSRFTPERITIGSLRGLQSTINGATDTSWVKYLEERSNWGKKIKNSLRYSMYYSVINYLEEKYNYDNVALCKETKEMWEALGMDYRKIKCNCV